MGDLEVCCCCSWLEPVKGYVPVLAHKTAPCARLIVGNFLWKNDVPILLLWILFIPIRS